jgi:hypothetical protein
MQVYFYLPEKYLPDAGRQEAWKSGTITRLEEGGKIASAQSWIYQTFLALEAAGVAVRLVHEVPERGIIVTLSGLVGTAWRPGPEVFFADIVADYVPHPGGHCHLVQNSLQARRIAAAVFQPHWPHPNLLPRDPARGERFERLAFFGDPANLAPELRTPEWTEQLRQRTGLDLAVVGADGWHDYREVDCVLAVRRFGREEFFHKPATKLYNAWLAGVPFVGGQDSAYRGDGHPGRNYLAAGSPGELVDALERLAKEPAVRGELVAAGRQAAQAFTREAVLARWRTLVEEILPGAAVRWGRDGVVSRRVCTFIGAQRAVFDRRWCR